MARTIRPPRLTREEARARNERLLRLPRAERRVVIRAVGRGRAVPDRRHAPLAVAVAQRQQRFWRTAWLLGPAIAVAQGAVTGLPPEQTLLLAAWGMVVLGALSWWWWSRARRAELENLALAGTGRDGAPRRHVPGGAAAGGGTAGSGGTSGAEGPARPPRPRGRKRRGRS